MTFLPLGLPPEITNDLGWTLIHFLWQGLVLAAILQAILPMCRNAAVRHNWALGILSMMGLAPVLTFLFIHNHQTLHVFLAAVSAPNFSGAPIPFGRIDFLVALWLAGIVILSLRALGGWYLVERLWRHDAFAVPDELLQRCCALQDRLALTRPIIFLQSALVNAPVVIGWFRPIILVPISAVTGLPPQQLDALILHELAHIRRFDTFTNILLILAETMLFYHPAIWWVSRRIRIEREHCCDDFAVSLCGDAALYVEALTSLKISKAMPVLVLAASGGRLKERVARLLDVPSKSRKYSPSAVMGLLLLCAVAASAATARSSTPRKPASSNTVKIARQETIQKTIFAPVNGSAPKAAAETPRRGGAPKPHLRTHFLPQIARRQDTAIPMMAQDDHNEAGLPGVASQASDNPAAPISIAPSAIQSAPSAGAIETVFVTAPKWPKTIIHNFVNSYANAATPTVGEIARWKFGICAKTYGLAKPEYDDFVTNRIEDIAVKAGVEIKPAPCHYSVEIVFTAKPQEFLDKVRQEGVRLLGPKPSQAGATATMRYPVQAWYATATRDISGQLILDDEDNAAFGNISMTPGAQAAPIMSSVPFYQVDGLRWRTSLNSELAHIYVIADTSKTQNFELAAVADYVAMLALSQTQSFDACKPMPSITNLISPDCGADLKPAALTDSDLAYLKAVYTMDPGADLQQQRNFIADRMAMTLSAK